MSACASIGIVCILWLCLHRVTAGHVGGSAGVAFNRCIQMTRADLKFDPFLMCVWEPSTLFANFLCLKKRRRRLHVRARMASFSQSLKLKRWPPRHRFWLSVPRSFVFVQLLIAAPRSSSQSLASPVYFPAVIFVKLRLRACFLQGLHADCVSRPLRRRSLLLKKKKKKTW